MRKYVLANLVGGLGNQLFIYATAYSLARRHGRTLFLNPDYYKSHAEVAHEHYQLDRFRIEASPIPRHCIPRLWSRPQAKYIRGIVRRVVPRLEVRTIVDRLEDYQGPLACGNEWITVLTGVWQSERYFNDCADELKAQFTLRRTPEGLSNELLQRVAAHNSVCVHIRRGDYVTMEKWRNSVYCLGVDYYRKALREISERVASPQLVVFSDDTKAARDVMSQATDLPTIYASDYQQGDAFVDFVTMRACKSFVLANSSFSWWAAWLSQTDSSVVVSPNAHSPNRVGRGAARVCRNWIAIDVTGNSLGNNTFRQVDETGPSHDLGAE